MRTATVRPMAQTDMSTPFKRGEKVRATSDLRGVPEGTLGKVAVINGFSWLRYWVQFSNGEDLGSIDHGKLVRAKDWDRFLRDRAAAADQPAAAPDQAESGSEDEASSGGGGDGATVNGVVIPQLLLDRSASARARLGA